MGYLAFLRDCDVAIITSPAALFYLSGFDQPDATIVVTESDAYYITSSLYEIAVKTAVRPEFTIKVMTRKEQADFLRLAVSNATKVGLEFDDMTLSRFRAIISEDKDVVDISPLLASMRLTKRPAETALIKEAEAIVDRAFAAVTPLLKVGVTERYIKEELRRAMFRSGAEDVAFDTIVAFGENAAMPHAVSSDRALRAGDCVLMDFGAKYRGYMSDFTRTLFCGSPTTKFLEAYDVVLKAQLAAIDYIEKGGRSAKEADRIAREVVDSSDFRGKFTHTLGHGVGIQIHEAPSLSTVSDDVLTDGCVFTVEPGVYLEGEFGIRIESLCVIENGKLTVIDRSDKQIITV